MPDTPACCRYDRGFHIEAAAVPALRKAHNTSAEITIAKKTLKRLVKLGAITFTEHPRPQIVITATNGEWSYELVSRDNTSNTSHWHRIAGGRT